MAIYKYGKAYYRQDVLDALPEMPILTEVSDIRQFLYTVKPRSYFEAAA